eukprot:4405371-Pyramimonas_sp.AAC.1
MTAPMKRLIHTVHMNLGHPRKEIFLKFQRAAHARSEVIRFVRGEYECADCLRGTAQWPCRAHFSSIG